jgi:hypothetical protein
MWWPRALLFASKPRIARQEPDDGVGRTQSTTMRIIVSSMRSFAVTSFAAFVSAADTTAKTAHGVCFANWARQRLDAEHAERERWRSSVSVGSPPPAR